MIFTICIMFSQSLQAQQTDTTATKQRLKNKGVVKQNKMINQNSVVNANSNRDLDGDGIPNGQDEDFTALKKGKGHGFLDLNGDGINDYAEDSDNDGIPNGQDPDWQKPLDGSGKQMKQGLGGFQGSGLGQRLGKSGQENCLGSGSKTQGNKGGNGNGSRGR